jgi:hypothetical protein
MDSRLHIIRELNDEFAKLLGDDPVRPHIPHDNRVGENREIFVYVEDSPKAVCCVSYREELPSTEEELFSPCEKPTTAVFYTIWSYSRGSGKELIGLMSAHLRARGIERMVTLSPKTELARKFHTGNGALTLRENEFTINYEYLDEK